MSVERALDRALAGHPVDEPGIGSLVAVAHELDLAFASEPASRSRERAMFVAGIGARRRGVSLGRFLVPALAVMLVVLVGVAGRLALPGDALYPVRQVLETLRLAPSPWKAVDQDIARGARLVAAAESALRQGDLPRAEQSANAAIARLDEAYSGLEGLEGSGAVERAFQITTLQDRAEEVIATVERSEEIPDPSDRGADPATDNSGRREGEDDEDEGDDDDDDNSGPGGGGDDADGDDADTFDVDGGDDADTFDGDDEVND